MVKSVMNHASFRAGEGRVKLANTMIDGLIYAGTLRPTARLMPPFRPELEEFNF